MCKFLLCCFQSLWKVSEIRSSGLLRQFLAEGIELYKLHCATLEEDGEKSVNKMSTEVVMASQQSEVVKVCYLMFVICIVHIWCVFSRRRLFRKC